MSIEKLDDGTGYKVRWRDTAGKSRRKKVTRWRDAIALDGEMKRKKAMGELINHERGTITLEDFWEVWWHTHAIPHLTTKTRTTYLALWKKNLQPHMGPMSMASISRASIANLVSLLASSLSASTVRQCLAILQGVMERAVEWDYIAKNPVKGVRRPRLVSREGRVLSMPEIVALCAELDLRSATLIRVLAGTGMRPGELRALCWGDVRRHSLSITKAISSNVVGPTKTNSMRSVSLTTDVSKALTEWFIASPAVSSTDLVFPAVDSDGIWTDLGWQMWRQRVFVPAARRAGLAGLRPYDLRHTYASQQIAAGADVLTLARSLGHSPTMTLTVYGHLLGGPNETIDADRDSDGVRGQSA